MCINCLTRTDAIAGQLAVAAAVLKTPVHRVLADRGLVDAPDPVRTDVRTIAYLRTLDLDPIAVMGADVVHAAEAWQAPARARRRWAWTVGRRLAGTLAAS